MTAPFKKSTAREYFESIVIAVILALFIRTFVVQAFKIPTGSMEPNLLVGDHLLVNKFVLGPTLTRAERMLLPISEVRRGEVIVFKYPEDPNRDFIKRVIGLPGETVQLRGHDLLINGKPLSEPYAHYTQPVPDEGEFALDVRSRYGPVTVPAGHYFMMGDNRDNSQDSRYWGFMPASYIKGKALMIYYSYEPLEDADADAGSAGLSRLPSLVTQFFTRIRWNRLLHQIH